MQERRRYRRKPFLEPADFSDGKGFYQRAIKNISAGGLYIRTANPVPVNSEVKICFMIGDDPFNLPAEVVRSGEGGMGVEFLFGSLHAKNRFRNRVQELDRLDFRQLK